MLTRTVSSSDKPLDHQILQGKLLVNFDVTEATNDDGVTLYTYTQIVTDDTLDPDEVLVEYKASIAQTFLDDTDFYFTVDRYSQLTEQEKEELESNRETARQDVRAYKKSDV